MKRAIRQILSGMKPVDPESKPKPWVKRGEQLHLFNPAHLDLRKIESMRGGIRELARVGVPVTEFTDTMRDLYLRDLVDLSGGNHSEAARRGQYSRTSVARHVPPARKKPAHSAKPLDERNTRASG